jgi:predicted PurR-regulated permease PerM
VWHTRWSTGGAVLMTQGRYILVAAGSPEAAAPAPGRAILRELLAIAAVGAGAWVVHRLGRVVLVVMLALFFAYVIAPLVDRAQRPFSVAGRSWRLPRGAAVALVYLLLASGVAVGGVILWPRAAAQFDAAVVSAPAYTESFHAWEHGWTKYYERVRIPLELRRSVDESVIGAGDTAGAYARGSLMTLLGFLSNIPWLVLVPVLSFLMLKDAVAIRRTILTALPHRIQLRGHRLFAELNNTLAAYIRAQLIACAIVGVLCGLGFALLGNPYAILLAVLATVLECIPLVGPLVVAAVAIGVAGLHGAGPALWTAAFLTVVRVVEDYVIYPRLIGRDIHLHPLIIILAVLVGAELGGVGGILTAIPLVALASVVVRHWLKWRKGDGLPAIPAPYGTSPRAHEVERIAIAARGTNAETVSGVQN